MTDYAALVRELHRVAARVPLGRESEAVANGIAAIETLVAENEQIQKDFIKMAEWKRDAERDDSDLIGQLQDELDLMEARAEKTEAERDAVADERDEALFQCKRLGDERDEAVAHLNVAAPMLQIALETGVAIPCPNCKIPMHCNADAGWICGNADSACHEPMAVGPFVEWGPYMALGFLARIDKEK